MGKEKKAFNQTLLGKLVSKAGPLIGDVGGIVAQAATGNIAGAISSAVTQLSGSKEPKAKEIINELELKRAEISLEFSKVELEETKALLLDVQDARSNRKDNDWMFNLVTIFGLIMCSFVIYTIVFVNVPPGNKELFIHLIGVIEGAVLLKIFTFFFGSSKGSKDKTIMNF